jgi:hypothetical protein
VAGKELIHRGEAVPEDNTAAPPPESRRRGYGSKCIPASRMMPS